MPTLSPRSLPAYGRGMAGRGGGGGGRCREARLPAGAGSPVQVPPTGGGGGGALAARPARPWTKSTTSYGPARGRQAGDLNSCRTSVYDIGRIAARSSNIPVMRGQTVDSEDLR